MNVAATFAAICRIMPPLVMALSTQSLVPRARATVLGAYFQSGAGPLWDDPPIAFATSRPRLAVAAQLGEYNAIVMRA